MAVFSGTSEKINFSSVYVYTSVYWTSDLSTAPATCDLGTINYEAMANVRTPEYYQMKSRFVSLFLFEWKHG